MQGERNNKMTRNKFNEELKQLLNSVRVMGVNL